MSAKLAGALVSALMVDTSKSCFLCLLVFLLPWKQNEDEESREEEVGGRWSSYMER